MPDSATISLMQVRPGVFVEQGLATPQRNGYPVVTARTVTHYAQLIGRQIKEIRFEPMQGEALPILMFTDGSHACVLRDPEGNGPGHLDIANA